MPARSITDRLKAGDLIIMDGGTGSELQRRGFNISQGATVEKRPTAPEKYAKAAVPEVLYRSTTGLGVWSAPANLQAPDLVRQVHEDYLKAGAEIIITNTFFTNKPMLERIGQGERWEDYARRAVRLAREARDKVNPQAYVAGGFAPPFSGNLRRTFQDVSRVLAEEGVDFLITEYLGGDTLHENPIADCVTAVDACAPAGLPVFLGVCNVKPDGTMLYGQTFDELGRALRGHDVAGIFIMCSNPQPTSAGLPKLRKAYEGPIGAYAELGYEENPRFGASPGEQFFEVRGLEYTPERYAEFARDWRKAGAQIIGGCCGTTPEHIQAVRAALMG
jgi:S-methylmethionine-dependent homocysteine/selenocysteine methylase